MSNFVPINLYEDDLVQDAEVHTRELQVEQGLELYKHALALQKDGLRDAAHKQYDALFNLEILNLTQVWPSLLFLLLF